jgi:hypothetical protein
MPIKQKLMPRIPAKQRTPKAWPEAVKAAWFKRMCIHITEGGSLRSFVQANKHGPSHSAWFDWIEESPIFAEQYTRARERSADTLAEELIAISDEVQDAGQFDAARVNAARLRVDARKWAASKLKPKVYADRIEQVTSGALTVKHEITDEERVKALALLMGKAVIDTAPNLIEAQRLLQAKTIDHEPDKP